MRAVKFSIGIAVSAFVVAMSLYAPMCNLSCAIVERAAAASLEPVETGTTSNHCHQTSDAQEGASSYGNASPASYPHDDSGKCPGHADATALLRQAKTLNAALSSSAQPVAIELPAALNLSLRDFRSIRNEGASFRSPPKRPSSSVLRI
jgi:hypothetical protein